MSTREENARAQKILDDALTADLSHAKDKAEEERIRKRYAEETTAAAQAAREEDERVARQAREVEEAKAKAAQAVEDARLKAERDKLYAERPEPSTYIREEDKWDGRTR